MRRHPLAILGAIAGFVAGYTASGRLQPSEPARQARQPQIVSLLPVEDDRDTSRLACQRIARWLGLEETAADSFLSLARTMSASRSRAEIVHHIQSLATWNPRWACQLALALQSVGEERELIVEALAAWAQSDPRSAFAFMQQHGAAIPGSAPGKLAECLLAENPWALGELFALANANSWPEETRARAFRRWAELAPQAAAAWLGEAEPELIKDLAQSAAPHFAKSDGGYEALLRMLDLQEDLQLTLDGGFQSSFIHFSDGWHFANSLRNKRYKGLYLSALLTDRAVEDPEGGRKAFDAAVEAGITTLGTAELARTIVAGSEDFVDAWQWITARKALFSDEARAAAMSAKVMSLMGGEDLTAYQNAIAEEISTSSGSAAAFEMPIILVSGSAYDNAEGVDEFIAWASGLDEGDMKAHALYGGITPLLQRDPVRASEILARLPPSEMKDHLMDGLIHEIPEDPERALQWLQLIGDDAIRLRVGKRVLQNPNLGTNEDKEALLHNSGLPKPFIERLQADE